MKGWKGYAVALAAGLLAGFAAGWFAGSHRTGNAPATENVVTRVDTIRVAAPVAAATTQTGTARYTLPDYVLVGICGRDSVRVDTVRVAATADSVTVELPTVARHYRDSTYEAWVSGPLDPRLDSIRVFQRTTTVTRTQHLRRWHIGITAGYGYTGKGFEPYIGVGLTYSIKSF